MALPNGVATGDTTQTSSILWARSTELGEVEFAYSTDPDFETILGTLTATVTDTAIPIRLSLDNLTPRTQYYYRATDAAGSASVGQFRTPAEIGRQAGLRFGVTGDWQGELMPHISVSNADERNLDFFVLMGDTLEADSESPALPGVTQASTLEEFRIKHEEIYSERFGANPWVDLRESTAIYSTWDDHELTNDFAGGATPANSSQQEDIFLGTDAEFVNDTPVFDAALQAFQEYKPLRDEFYGETGDPRTANEPKLYRYNTFGNDAASYILDVRSFRDVPIPFTPETADAELIAERFQTAFDPDRTMLGEAQKEQFKADLLAAEEAGITWKFVMSTVPMQNFGVPTFGERWEGYAAERTEILEFIEDNDIDNVVFITGDFHGNVVNNVTYQEEFGGEQIPTGVMDIMVGPGAIQLTVPFLPEPFNETFAAPFGTATVAFTPASLLEEQGKSQAEYLALEERSAKDEYAREIIDYRLIDFFENQEFVPYDPVGLEGSPIDAELLQGSYFNGHTYGWSEFAIDPNTQQLTVTNYGIEPYTQAELEADPDAVTSRTPEIITQFTVNPVDDPELIFGTPTLDNFDVATNPVLDGNADLIFAGGGDDLVDTSTVPTGNNRVYSGSGVDEVILGRRDAFGGQSQRAFGGDGNDILDASPGLGNNRLYGGNGDDELYAGTNDRLFGGAGNDYLEAATGEGVNRLYGGEGDDFLTGNAGDVLVGGQDADIMVVLAGGDVQLTGGTEADQFWIVGGELPAVGSLITDFEPGTDTIGLNGNLVSGFDQLTLTPTNGDTLIEFNSQTLAIVNGVTGLDVTNFTFSAVPMGS